jgi:hypothetical protein
MPKSLKRKDAGRHEPADDNPKDKPLKDTREPARKAEGPSELPDTNTREEVETIRPNLKR